MILDSKDARVFITGSAGFIGMHLAKRLLEIGCTVHGFDGFTDYYDVNLKLQRHSILQKSNKFSQTRGLLEDKSCLVDSLNNFQPDVVIHLAAQAGVRYSIERPDSYISSNIQGTFNLLEAVKNIASLKHFLFASTSSVYGGNTESPFSEKHKSDLPLTIYAATKKSTELMAHSYSHLFEFPATAFRFFTVYGPWGRPDLALFKFVDCISRNEPITIFNNGDMMRSFTFVDDLVEGIIRLTDNPPEKVDERDLGKKFEGDSLSPVAPFRVVNIGSPIQVGLMDLVEEIERVMGVTANKKFLSMQAGDVQATHADVALLKTITGFTPNTSLSEGVERFISWFKKHYPERF